MQLCIGIIDYIEFHEGSWHVNSNVRGGGGDIYACIMDILDVL